MALALPYFPLGTIPPEQMAKIQNLQVQREINTGLNGVIQMFGDYIITFSILLSMNSSIGILAKIFLLGNIVMLFIIFPHIIDALRLFTDFLSRIISNPILGTIIGVGVIASIAIVGFSFISGDSTITGKTVLPNGTVISTQNLQSDINDISTCESCIQNSGNWVWCDGVINPFKTIIGCIEQTDFISNGDIITSFNQSCNTNNIWKATKISGISNIQGSKQASCQDFNLQFSVFGGG